MGKKEKVLGRKKTTSCGGVIWRVDDKGNPALLLIKQFAHKERWGIPKGHVDSGETLEECALREVREETGLKIQLGERMPDVFIANSSEDKTVISWLSVPVGSHEPNQDDPDCEIADVRWFELTQLPEIMTYQRSLIAQAVERIRQLAPPVSDDQPG